eukprot:GHVP01063131.1.p1 GENE.GHVP01063131.1~~GHVP01063131.1.p1  ORF type:complete len:159 (-),score=3.53 GHVP01063131.1:697-1173(-)
MMIDGLILTHTGALHPSSYSHFLSHSDYRTYYPAHLATQISDKYHAHAANLMPVERTEDLGRFSPLFKHFLHLQSQYARTILTTILHRLPSFHALLDVFSAFHNISYVPKNHYLPKPQGIFASVQFYKKSLTHQLPPFATHTRNYSDDIIESNSPSLN